MVGWAAVGMEEVYEIFSIGGRLSQNQAVKEQLPQDPRMKENITQLTQPCLIS